MVWSIVGLVGPSWLKSLSESEGVSGEWKIRKDPRVRKEKFLPLHVEGRSGGGGDRFRFRFVLFFVL